MSAQLSAPSPVPATLPPAVPDAEALARARSSTIPEDAVIDRTVAALEKNGIHVIVVPDGATARTTVLGLVPDGAEVLDATSRTLLDIGLRADLGDEKRYRAVRPTVMRLAKEGRTDEQRKAGSAPTYVVGSVHAVTEQGDALIASATGSQLASYVYGAAHVIWVVGAQKIVPTVEAGFRRIEETATPLEDARAMANYGIHTAIAKVLVVHREFQPGRVTMVLVREALGF